MSKRVNLEWDDIHALPPKLDLTTRFVFQRMTGETLNAVGLYNGRVRILDVGCGMGIDTGEMAKEGHYLVGLEPSRIMVAKARDWLKGLGIKAYLVQGIGEDMPFKPGTFDKTVCKGALDHFYDPETSIKEMAGVTKTTGEVIIAVTNYESLGCLLARIYIKIQKYLGNKKASEKKPWEGYGKVRMQSSPEANTLLEQNKEKLYPWDPPGDHTFKFDYFVLKKALEKYLIIESVAGVSLLWNFPHWHTIIEKLPKGIAWALLTVLDKIASRFPILSDILVSKCRLK
jgi:ubiquinone/menaquinone biosynthesis C-methylase UbiE